MRANLLSLQHTVNLMDRTQDRLSTGKKVNSALDNPVSFFAAQGLNERASDLSALKDTMGQGIQTVKAADAGIKGITALIESARGIAQAARSTSDATTRQTYSNQFDDLLSQIDELAGDAGYRGTNLLGSGSLTVNFNEDSSSSLTITGVDATTTGLSIAAAAGNWANDADIDTAITELDAGLTSLRSTSSTLSANLAVIDTRQDFTSDMTAVLESGADSLTLADMNEEGANMLMLQTRQALSTSALSMASQAAQSVLRLF
jgi:flagellin-like hook-associated protein FlgL